MQIWLAMAVLMLAGCTTFRTIPAEQGSKPVPPDRVLAYQEDKPGTTRVVITRDEGILGSGCYLGVLAADTVLGRFDVGESAEFHLPPGRTAMTVVQDPQGKGLCALSLVEPVI